MVTIATTKWSHALKDELRNGKSRTDFNNMYQFKFNQNDLKAFSILGVTVGTEWQKIQRKTEPKHF